MTSNSEKVKQFTEGMLGHSIPSRPKPLGIEQARFICSMVISELSELMSTVVSSQDQLIDEMQMCLDSADIHTYTPILRTDEVVSEQADAMVDAMYYMYDTAARQGINLDKIFDVVHEANMDKRDLETKKFIRRESDGKVLKREGWQPPNVLLAMQEQIKNGGFN